MSDSKALVSADNLGFFRRAGSAWHIIKGDPSANPLYPQLLDMQHQLSIVDRDVRSVLEGNKGTTNEIVKDLVENYTSLQENYTSLQHTLDVERTTTQTEIESLKNNLSAEKDKLRAIIEERDLLKQQLIHHSSKIKKIRDALEGDSEQ